MREPTELLVWETFTAGDGHPGLRTRPATVDDVRAAVESGTIKGELDALIGEVGLRLLRYERSGGTLTIERVQTTILNVFDGSIVVGPVPDGGSET